MCLGSGRESSNIEPGLMLLLSTKQAPSELTLTDLVISSKRFPQISAPLTLIGIFTSTLFFRRRSSNIFRWLTGTRLIALASCLTKQIHISRKYEFQPQIINGSDIPLSSPDHLSPGHFQHGLVKAILPAINLDQLYRLSGVPQHERNLFVAR